MSIPRNKRAKTYVEWWADRMLGGNQMAIWLMILFLLFAQVIILGHVIDAEGITDTEGLEISYKLLGYFVGFMAVGGTYIGAAIVSEVAYHTRFGKDEWYTDGESA